MKAKFKRQIKPRERVAVKLKEREVRELIMLLHRSKLFAQTTTHVFEDINEDKYIDALEKVAGEFTF